MLKNSGVIQEDSGGQVIIKKDFQIDFLEPTKPSLRCYATTTVVQLILTRSEQIANLSWMIVQFLNRRRTWIADKVGKDFTW